MTGRSPRELMLFATLLLTLLGGTPWILDRLGPEAMLGPLLLGALNHVAALGLGLLVTRRLVDDQRRFTWGWPCGLFLFGVANFVLAHLGAFNAVAAVALWLVGGIGWLVHLPWLRARLDGARLALGAVSGVTGLWLAGVVWRASVEPLFVDALIYHLGVPTQMAARGAAITEPHVTFAAMPFIGELASSPALLLGDERAFAISHALALVALVVLVADAARRHLHRGAAQICALLAATSPLLVSGALSQKSDTLFTLAAALTLDALACLLDDDEPAAPAVLVLALGCAFALSTKYLALGYVPFVLAGALLFARRRVFALPPRTLALAVLLLSLGGLTLVKNFILFGDPLFPLLGVGAPTWAAHARVLYRAAGPSIEAGAIWRLPFDLFFTVRSPQMNDLPGVALLVLPALTLFSGGNRRLRVLALITLLMTPVWLFLFFPYARFFPYFLVLAIFAGGHALAVLLDTQPRYRLLLGALAAVAVAHGAMWSLRADEPLLLTSAGLLGEESALDRRARRHPSARVFAWIETRTLRDDTVLVATDGRVAYLHRPAIYSDRFGYPRFLELLDGATTPSEAAARLRAAGVAAVVVAPGFLATLAKQYGWPDASEHVGWQSALRALGPPHYDDGSHQAWSFRAPAEP